MKLAATVLLVIVVLGIYFLTRPASKNESPKVRLKEKRIANTQSPVEFQNEPAIASNKTRIKRTKVDGETNSNINRAEIDQKIEIISQASTKSDPASFQLIITALQDEKPEVRKAALDATVQFGSRDAIPILKELAAKTEDAREKVEILDAIEFLELPSLSEIRRPRRTNSNPAGVKGALK